jgi:hypothetical protein
VSGFGRRSDGIAVGVWERARVLTVWITGDPRYNEPPYKRIPPFNELICQNRYTESLEYHLIIAKNWLLRTDSREQTCSL